MSSNKVSLLSSVVNRIYEDYQKCPSTIVKILLKKVLLDVLETCHNSSTPYRKFSVGEFMT